jgi:pyrimidine-nucleoside phosphorylase
LGHTGGTLDKLESIPGFRTALSEEAFITQVARVGCAIAGQSERLVPADAKLYALRDVTATVDSIPLIASSIMSKKIAAGSHAILLDVKCGRGAFMQTETDARSLAQAMVEIGRHAGRRTVAVLSAMDEPLGRAVGNAVEVQEAIDTLRGDGPPDLEALSLTIGGWMLLLGGNSDSAADGTEQLRRLLHSGDALAKFEEMVAAQGGDATVTRGPSRLPQAPIHLPVPAPASGVVTAIDALAVGVAAMRLGAGRVKKGDPIDPAVGITLRRKTGDAVASGDDLATVHARTEDDARRAVADVAAAYALGAAGGASPSLVRAVVE